MSGFKRLINNRGVQARPRPENSEHGQSIATNLEQANPVLNGTDIREQFQEAIEVLEDGFVVYDQNDKLIICNSAFRKLHSSIDSKIQPGVDFETIIRSSFPDQDESFIQDILDRRSSEHSTEKTFEAHGDRWIHQRDTRTPSGLTVSQITDVSDSKVRDAQLESLQVSEQSRHQDLVDLINRLDLGVVVVDKDLEVELVNDAYHKVCNTASATLKPGLNFRDLLDINRDKGIYDIDDDAWENYVQERLDEIREGNREPTLFTRADGCQLIYSILELSKGRRLITYLNVTEQKEQEAALKAAQANAEAADRAKSEFLANMSHEIRTPMNGVMGMAELLAKTELDAKQKTFTDVIVKSGNSLLTIINDILDFSKIDAGQLELDPAPFALLEAIEDVATLVSSKVAEKDLELIVRADPTLPEMFVGDAGRIRQIVTNLMGNAVKFTEVGHVYVNITPVGSVTESSGSEEQLQKIRFAVEDTGIGIPQQDLQRVFEKFSQVDTSATRRHEGTGLGLSIASSLVKLMNGEIGVNSTVGDGSTFWFEISMPVHSGRKTTVVPHDVSGSCIMIVDDNEVNRAILSEQLQDWNFDHATAESGSEALAIMRAAMTQNISIDCIILDYHMPGMNGADVVHAMKAERGLRDIPIIMLTSVEETSEGKAFSSLGINGHLTKPTRSALLLEMIIDVLQHDRTKRELQQSVEQGQDPISLLTKNKKETTMPQPVQNETPSLNARVSEGINILLCEDNEVNQIVFTQILQQTEYSFKIANNGKEGLALYEKYTPDMILMDVSMPQMNGIEATMEVRAREEKQGLHTPIVGVTAHAIKGDMEKCLDAGMDDYLSKPVSPDTLVEKVESWMKEVRKKASAA